MLNKVSTINFDHLQSFENKEHHCKEKVSEFYIIFLFFLLFSPLFSLIYIILFYYINHIFIHVKFSSGLVMKFRQHARADPGIS